MHGDVNEIMFTHALTFLSFSHSKTFSDVTDIEVFIGAFIRLVTE